MKIPKKNLPKLWPYFQHVSWGMKLYLLHKQRERLKINKNEIQNK